MSVIKVEPEFGEIKLREISIGDLHQVSAVHVAAFPKSAVTKLGLEAVRRYYEWQLDGSHRCVALGVWEGGQLCGFSFAGRFSGSLMGFLKKHQWYLLGRVICRPWLAFNPLFREKIKIALKSLRRAFFKRSKSKAIETQFPRDEKPIYYGILSIAVAPGAKRKGIGSLLMKHNERIAHEWGVPRMLLTVSVDNAQATAFYERLGWEREIPTGEPNGHWRGRMFKRLGSPSTGESPSR